MRANYDDDGDKYIFENIFSQIFDSVKYNRLYLLDFSRNCHVLQN